MLALKKIGILTEYFESMNYGGVLQAYALCHILSEMGFCAEQVQYFKSEEAEKSKDGRNSSKSWYSVFNPIQIRRRIIRQKLNTNLHRKQDKRRSSFKDFREGIIPHSNIVYDDNTLGLANDKYDAFVVGSDQVWNPNYWHPGYMLSFVNGDKLKIAYGVSLGVDSLTAEQVELFKTSIFGFKGISVREENSINLLQDILKSKIELVLDPVFLLTKEQWKIVSSERSIPEKYIFTYFLGDSRRNRRIAEEYAHYHGFKIVALPHVNGYYRAVDENFGDYQIFDASPQDFIALIKNAEVIFTDSFHAVAFSGIFEKEFFAFQRNETGEMSARMVQITSLFDARKHFCANSDECGLEYIKNLEKIDYDNHRGELKRLKIVSADFLYNNLVGLRG